MDGGEEQQGQHPGAVSRRGPHEANRDTNAAMPRGPRRDEPQAHYDVLELPLGAPLAEVERQYQLLVQKWHPDRFAQRPEQLAEATAKTARINAARTAIRDALRAESRAPRSPPEPWSAGPSEPPASSPRPQASPETPIGAGFPPWTVPAAAAAVLLAALAWATSAHEQRQNDAQAQLRAAAMEQLKSAFCVEGQSEFSGITREQFMNMVPEGCPNVAP